MKQPAQRSYLSLILFLLYAPLLVIVVMSFNQSTYSTQWAGFTVDWYRTLLEDSSMWQATTHSVILALTTAISASTLATLTAVLLLRKQLPGRKLLMSLILVLIVIPDIIFGIALLLTYNAIKIPFGFWSLLLAHCAFSYPFTLMVIYSRMQDANLDVIEAALDLGASDFTVLTKVLLPILWPAIVSGAMLAIALSLDDVIISYFVAGPDFEILPLRIFSLVRQGINPEVNAMFSLLFIFTLMISLVVYRLNKKVLQR